MNRSFFGTYMLCMTMMLATLFVTSCATGGDKEVLKEKEQETLLEPLPKVGPFPARLAEETRRVLEASDERELLQELMTFFSDNPEYPPATIDFDLPMTHKFGVQVTFASVTSKMKLAGDAHATLRILDWNDPTRALLRCEGKAPVVLVKAQKPESLGDSMRDFWKICRQNACADLLQKLDAANQRKTQMQICSDYQEWRRTQPAAVATSTTVAGSAPNSASDAPSSTVEEKYVAVKTSAAAPQAKAAPSPGLSYMFVNEAYVGPVGFDDAAGAPLKPTAVCVVDTLLMTPPLTVSEDFPAEGRVMVTFIEGLNGIMWVTTGKPIDYSATPTLSTEALDDLAHVFPGGPPDRQLLPADRKSMQVTNIACQSAEVVNRVLATLVESTGCLSEEWAARQSSYAKGYIYGAASVSSDCMAFYVTPEAPYTHFNYHMGPYVMPGDVIVGSGKQYIQGIGVDLPQANTEDVTKANASGTAQSAVSTGSEAGRQPAMASIQVSSVPAGLEVTIIPAAKPGMPELAAFTEDVAAQLTKEERERLTPTRVDLKPGDYLVAVKTTIGKQTVAGNRFRVMWRDGTRVVAPYQIRFPYVEEGNVYHLVTNAAHDRYSGPKDDATAIAAFPKSAESDMQVCKIYPIHAAAGERLEIAARLDFE